MMLAGCTRAMVPTRTTAKQLARVAHLMTMGNRGVRTRHNRIVFACIRAPRNTSFVFHRQHTSVSLDVDVRIRRPKQKIWFAA